MPILYDIKDDWLFKQGIELGVEQGIELGVEQGIELGVEQGIELGVEQEKQAHQKKIIQAVIKWHVYGMKAKIIADAMDIPISKVKAIIKAWKKKQVD